MQYTSKGQNTNNIWKKFRFETKYMKKNYCYLNMTSFLMNFFFTMNHDFTFVWCHMEKGNQAMKDWTAIGILNRSCTLNWMRERRGTPLNLLFFLERFSIVQIWYGTGTHYSLFCLSLYKYSCEFAVNWTIILIFLLCFCMCSKCGYTLKSVEIKFSTLIA